MTKKLQPKLHISLSREHNKHQPNVAKAFEGLDVSFDSGVMRFSAEEMAMQVMIAIGTGVVSSAVWDAIKVGIKNICKQFSTARITLRDSESIMYTIKSDSSVSVLVVPDRIKEFEHIKTIDDLISYFNNKSNSGSSSTWQKVKLGDYLLNNPDYGINAASVEFSDTLPAYLRITDISEDGKFLSAKKTSVNHPDSKRYILSDGDIVFARTGASVGKSYLYNKNDGELVFAGFLIRMRPNKKKLHPGFLSAYTHTSKYEQWVKETSPRSGQPGINSVEYANLMLSVPPISEQERIVSVLETCDQIIERLSRKIETKIQVKKGLVQDLLTGKKRLVGFKEKWETSKLAKLGVFSKGSGITKEELSETGFNAIRYGELYTRHHVQIKKVYSFIPSKIIPSTKKIQYGDILFAGSGETINEIGKSAVYLLKEDCYVGGDIIVFTPKNADSLFLSYFLNNGEARKKLRELGQGQSVVHIYKGDIENLEFSIPPVKEQIAIVNILTTADKEITELEKKLSIIKEQKRYLLNNLITGTIRTPETLSAKITS